MNSTNEQNDNGLEVGKVEGAFEAFEEGKSLEEVNVLLLGSDDSKGTAEDDSDSADNNNDDSLTANGGAEKEDLEASSGSHPEPDEKKKKQDVKSFTQEELDKLVGHRINNIKSHRDSLQKDYDELTSAVSKLLGVEKNEVMSKLNEQQIRKEAEESDVEDVETFTKYKLSEKEKIGLQRQLAMREQQDIIYGQIHNYMTANPDFDIEKAMQDEQFVVDCNEFYNFAKTRDNALEFAIDAYKSRNNISSSPKPVHEPKEKPKRAKESASDFSAPKSSVHLDYSKMKDKDFKNIMDRLYNGEKINL